MFHTDRNPHDYPNYVVRNNSFFFFRLPTIEIFTMLHCHTKFGYNNGIDTLLREKL